VVILSTHIVDDVKELCTNMAIINQGSVLLQGNPMTAIKELTGKVYRKTIKKNELDLYRQEYTVIADKLLLGKPIIQILSENDPGNGFEPFEAQLEDVYFSQIFGGTTDRQEVNA
jgi:ABC-2 type transport system ATP-binding protein